MSIERIPVLKHQGELLASKAPNVAMPAGLGAGKSRAVALKLIQLAQINHPYPVCAIEPTRGHLRNVLVPELSAVCEEIGGHFVHRKSESKGRIHLGDGQVYEVLLFSGDRPEGIVGVNAAAVVVDEAGHMKDDLLRNARARSRHPKAVLRQHIEVGTPEEFNAFYDFCEGSPPPDLHLIRARTLDNFFLPDGPAEYIAKRLSHLTAEEVDRYTRGLFVARHGRVYSYYDPQIHDVEMPLRRVMQGEQVILADFGSRTVVWAFASIHEVEGEDVMHVWGEVVGQATDTWAQLGNAKAYLLDGWAEGHGAPFEWEEVVEATTVHCDASGQFQGHVDGVTNTDVEILSAEGFTVDTLTRNPPVLDRVYSVQDRLRRRTRSGRPLLTFDPKRAPYTLSCIAKQGYDKYGRPEKSKDNLTGKRGLDHGADAVGYGCYARWPVSAPRGNEVTFRH